MLFQLWYQAVIKAEGRSLINCILSLSHGCLKCKAALKVLNQLVFPLGLLDMLLRSLFEL